jgi:phospholipid/cholesterol/gamma-HCH transport system permease protein
MLKSMLGRPENFRMYWKEFMHQCVEMGIGSLSIVVIVSIFLGAVTTVQTAYQFVSPLLPLSGIAQVVRDSMILELSPTVLSIVLAGVIGGNIVSKLGNMRITEQVDALEIMGINPGGYLIMPKIMAALFVIPLLFIVSVVIGIWSGRLIGSISGIIPFEIFDNGLLHRFDQYNLYVGLSKIYVFSFIISSIPAYYGFHVKGGALEIGRAGTQAVVVSCILILITDYLLAALLL